MESYKQSIESTLNSLFETIQIKEDEKRKDWDKYNNEIEQYKNIIVNCKLEIKQLINELEDIKVRFNKTEENNTLLRNKCISQEHKIKQLQQTIKYGVEERKQLEDIVLDLNNKIKLKLHEGNPKNIINKLNNSSSKLNNNSSFNLSNSSNKLNSSSFNLSNSSNKLFNSSFKLKNNGGAGDNIKNKMSQINNGYNFKTNGNRINAINNNNNRISSVNGFISNDSTVPLLKDNKCPAVRNEKSFINRNKSIDKKIKKDLPRIWK